MRKNYTRKNGGGFGKALKHFMIPAELYGGKSGKLWMAAYHGDVDDITKSLNSGASINKKYENAILATAGWGNMNNTTALMVAASQGHKDAVELLLEKGADPNIVTKDGKTAYDFAKKNNHNSTASVLEEVLSNSNSNKSKYNTYKPSGGRRRTRKHRRTSRKH